MRATALFAVLVLGLVAAARAQPKNTYGGKYKPGWNGEAKTPPQGKYKPRINTCCAVARSPMSTVDKATA